MSRFGEDSSERAIRNVLDAYRTAMTDRDLSAMDRLFGEKATVFENGKKEGLWTEYRDHHLKPEFDGLSAFELGPSHLVVTSTATLAWATDHFNFQVVTKEGERIELKAVVTFILRHVDAGSVLPIAARIPGSTPLPSWRA